MSATEYGNPPQLLGRFDLQFDEYMHYMYLPIFIREDDVEQVSIPERLLFLRPLIDAAIAEEMVRGQNDGWSYVYVTARRGYATPGNPLNRPGWHSDGFGTDDINYVWTDRYPTLFAEGTFTNISDDHIESARQFEAQIDSYATWTSKDRRAVWREDAPITVRTYDDGQLMRLDPSVIHSAPNVPGPGGERSFVKVSFSHDRYDLKGNAHNYGIDYNWPMYERQAVRNDPASAGRDSAAS